MSDPDTGFEPIGIGLRPNDGSGDPPRLVGEKLNRMLAELYARIDELEARLDAEPPASVVPTADFSDPDNSGFLAALA